MSTRRKHNSGDPRKRNVDIETITDDEKERCDVCGGDNQILYGIRTMPDGHKAFVQACKGKCWDDITDIYQRVCGTCDPAASQHALNYARSLRIAN
jgi:hypothetical protein